jgi:hypothetical protein
MTWSTELDPLLPASDGPAGQGDDELRLIKGVVTVTWPELEEEITMGSAGAAPTSAQVSELWDKIAALETGSAISPFQLGMIVLWNTSNGSVPAGWTVCNGTNVNNVEVPNMEDRFPIGASATRPDGSGGGADGTAVTDSAGAHSHTVPNPTIAMANLPNNLGDNINLSMAPAGQADSHDFTSGVARSAYSSGQANSTEPVTVTQANSTSLPIDPTSTESAHTHTLTQAVPSYIAFTYICYVGV